MLKQNRSQIAKFVFILLVTPLLFVGYFKLSEVSAQTSSTINLQGKIVRNNSGFEGMNVTTGSPACVQVGADTCDFQVKYYSALTGGLLFLTETFTNREIGQYGGVFELSLGSGLITEGTHSTLEGMVRAESSIFMEILFSPAGNSTFTETFTRMPMQSSAYSIRSKYSEMAKGAFKFENAPNPSGYTGSDGMVYYDTTTGGLKLYSAGAWLDVSTGTVSSFWETDSILSYTHSPSQFLESSGIATLSNFGLDTTLNRAWVHGSSSRTGFSVYSNFGGATDWPLVSFKADAANFGNSILQLIQDGSGSILEGYKGSNKVFDIDNRGDMHLSSDGILYLEPFSGLPSSGNLFPGSGEGCLYSTGGNIYWDGACNASSPTMLNALPNLLWTDAGTFTHLTSTSDNLVLGGNSVATGTFFFDMTGASGRYFRVDNSNNTETLFTIDSSGNVGIGTAVPGAKLDISGTSSNISNAIGNITIIPAQNLIISQGRVGIGTVSPTSLLSVGSTSQFQVDTNGNIVRIRDLAYSWPSSHTTGGLLTNSGSGTLTWTTLAGLGAASGTGVAGQVTFWSGTSTIVGDNGFWWDNVNKRLGIGTNAPQATLDIAGATSEIANTSGNMFIIPAQNLLITQGNVGIGAATTPRGIFDIRGSGDVYLTSNTSNSGTTRTFLSADVYMSTHNASNWSYFQARREDSSGTTNMSLRVTNSSVIREGMTILGLGGVSINNPSSGSALSIGRLSGQASIRSTESWLIMDSNGNPAALNYYHNANVLLAYGGGNVGIGTIDIPSSRLHVNGSISSSLHGITANNSLYVTDLSFAPSSSTSHRAIYAVVESMKNVALVNGAHRSALQGMIVNPDNNNSVFISASIAGENQTATVRTLRGVSVFVNSGCASGSGATVCHAAHFSAAEAARIVLGDNTNMFVGVGQEPTTFFQVHGDGTWGTSGAFAVDARTIAFGVSTQSTQRLCHTGTDGTGNQRVTPRDCAGTGQADLAEFYDTDGTVEPGDIVYPVSGGYKVTKSNQSYQRSVIGIVSTNPIADGIMGYNVKSPLREPIVLVGRAPLKVSLENGPIKIGDYLTSSSTPGVAMKATKGGAIVGVALEDYDGSIKISSAVAFEEYDRNIAHATELKYYVSNPSQWNSDVGKIMVFVNVSWYDPSVRNISENSFEIQDPGWYRVAQTNDLGSAKMNIENMSIGSSQSLKLNLTSEDIDIASNVTNGNSVFSKVRLSKVNDVVYLDLYIEEVLKNKVEIRIEGKWDISYITRVGEDSSSKEFILTGIRFGVSDIFAVTQNGLTTSGTLHTSGMFSDVGSRTNRWNDIYTKGTIRLGSGSSEGGIRYNVEKKRLEFSNDGINWVEMGDLTSNVVMSPEYSGAILYADGSDNHGRMTSDAINTGGVFKNYYEWVSDREILQDYDILVRITLPSDFVSWREDAIALDFMTENAASITNNKVEIALMGDGGIDTEVKDGISKMPGAWERISIKAIDITQCKKAGDSCTLKLSMYSKENYYVRVGDISLNYNRGL